MTVGMLWNATTTRWRLIAAITGCMVLVCLGVAVFGTPQYAATTILAPPTASVESGGLGTLAGQFGGLADMAGIDLVGRQDVDQTLAVLQSEEFLQRFVETEGVAQVFYAEQWDPLNKQWRPDRSLSARVSRALQALIDWLSPDTTRSGVGTSGPESWTVLRRFVPLMSVQKDKRTQIVTLSIRWKDPKIAATWANSLVRHLNEEARSRAVSEANDSLGYLANQLQRTQVLEVRDALYRLVETEQKRAMIASTRQELALRVLAKAQIPRERIFPRRKSLIIGGLAGGLVLGLFAAVGAGMLFTTLPPATAKSRGAPYLD